MDILHSLRSIADDWHDKPSWLSGRQTLSGVTNSR